MRTLRTLLPGMAGALIALPSAPLPAMAQTTSPTFVELGECSTRSGQPVLDCRIAYRTAGTLNEAKDNVVLIPSWYGGTSRSLYRLLGPEAMVDTTRYFAVMVDMLGNGVSSSPSNSAKQPGAAFPRVTVADMVMAQHRLVREHLGIARLHAVVGFSMGAMQALEWAVRYPDDVGTVVSLLGSPHPTPHDVFTMRTLRWLARLGSSAELQPDSSRVPLADFWHVIAFTPARSNKRAIESLDSLVLSTAAAWTNFDLEDNRLQLEAVLGNDVAADLGGDLERAAKRVRARVLLVVSPDDRIVNPDPAIAFGRIVEGAEVLEVPSRCGHFALYCEPVVGERVRAFLKGGAVARR
jgi:homoserine O-acetyltransferase/O-succinyltransferase